jgi:Thiamine biosynthesis ATP pyrophosphatase
MYSDIILREGEMVLKGRNRRDFEYRLIKNVKRVTKDFKGVSVERSYGRIYIRNANENTIGNNKRCKTYSGNLLIFLQ